MTAQHMIRISNWIAFAKSLGYEIPSNLTSRTLRDAAADASIPAEMVANVWCVRRDDTQRIAAIFGMSEPATAKHAA